MKLQLKCASCGFVIETERDLETVIVRLQNHFQRRGKCGEYYVSTYNIEQIKLIGSMVDTLCMLTASETNEALDEQISAYRQLLDEEIDSLCGFEVEGSDEDENIELAPPHHVEEDESFTEPDPIPISIEVDKPPAA